MITISVENDQEVILRLRRLPENVRKSLLKKVTSLTLKLERRVKEKLSGQVLNVRTGALRRSIFSRVTETRTEIVGRVASSGDVKYAGIHEFGGVTSPHTIEAKRGQALRFMLNGKEMFRRSVNHPGSKMPKRSFLRTSLAEMRPEIVTGLRDAVVEGAKQK